MAAGSPSFDDDRIGLFDLPHDAFFIAAFDGYLKRANPAFARSLGYTLEENAGLAVHGPRPPRRCRSGEGVDAEPAGRGSQPISRVR